MGDSKHITLCCDCVRAGYGDNSTCPWEREFKPVPGWKSKPTRLLQSRRPNGKPIYDDSFFVMECPLYQKHKRK